MSQAVQEIKDLKANLRMRDEKIEGLTSQVNGLGIAVNDAETENEELRERLGLDPKEPLDTEAINEKKMVKNQQQAALNRVLSKEVLDSSLINLPLLFIFSFLLLSYLFSFLFLSFILLVLIFLSFFYPTCSHFSSFHFTPSIAPLSPL